MNYPQMSTLYAVGVDIVAISFCVSVKLSFFLDLMPLLIFLVITST